MADATYIHRVLYLLVRVQQQLLDDLHFGSRIQNFSDLDVLYKIKEIHEIGSLKKLRNGSCFMCEFRHF